MFSAGRDFGGDALMRQCEAMPAHSEAQTWPRSLNQCTRQGSTGTAGPNRPTRRADPDVSLFHSLEIVTLTLSWMSEFQLADRARPAGAPGSHWQAAPGQRLGQKAQCGQRCEPEEKRRAKDCRMNYREKAKKEKCSRRRILRLTESK